MNINPAVYQADNFQAANLFTNAAQRNVQTQMATLRSKGEMEESSGEKPSHEADSFSASAGFDAGQAQEKFECAATSGGLTSLMEQMETDDEKKAKDSDTKTGKATMFGKGSKKLYGPGANFDYRTVEQSESSEDINQKPAVDTVSNKSPRDIQGDVPDGLYAAAKAMVEGKIQKGQPSSELLQLKAVETAPLQLKPANNVDIAPIHDSNNKPMLLDMEEQLSA
ncbi:MAG: hypothetical protein LWY06_01775 [Firmicutes bacterium]|nr:hypothetical protein [Bacillota bacterium]